MLHALSCSLEDLQHSLFPASSRVERNDGDAILQGPLFRPAAADQEHLCSVKDLLEVWICRNIHIFYLKSALKLEFILFIYSLLTAISDIKYH